MLSRVYIPLPGVFLVSAPNLHKVSGTGTEVVPNFPKCRSTGITETVPKFPKCLVPVSSSCRKIPSKYRRYTAVVRTLPNTPLPWIFETVKLCALRGGLVEQRHSGGERFWQLEKGFRGINTRNSPAALARNNTSHCIFSFGGFSSCSCRCL